MPSVECSICSEEFGKRNESSAVIATSSCGHVFHETCLSNWLEHCKSKPEPEPETCPECRQPVNMAQTLRIYFHSSTVVDNLQEYAEYLSSVIAIKSDRIQAQSMDIERLKLDWMNRIREKDFEIERLNEKMKRREYETEIHNLNAKIEKLKHKFKELKQKHAECPKIDHSVPETVNLRENGSPYMQLPYMTNSFMNTGLIRTNRTHTNQMYNPVSSTATQQSLANNTNSIITRPVYRNPLAMFPATVQPSNSYQQQAVITTTHQENLFPPNIYNPLYYNPNNQNQFF